MRQTVIWALALAGAMSTSTACSQDLFSSANSNSTVHSYNYLEVQYLLDVDTSPPVLATLLLDVSDNWSFKAEYLNQDFGNLAGQLGLDPNTVLITAGAEAMSIGGLYHQPLSQFAKSDFVGGFMLGRVEVKAEAPAFNLSSEDAYSFQEFYAGARRTFTSNLEGEATINIYRDSSDTDVTLDLKMVFRVIDSFDVALALNELGEADIVGIGLRYTW